MQAGKMPAHLGDLLLRLLWHLLALSLSLSSFHAACPQALHARNSSARTTCTRASVPIVRTSAPRTTLAWMKTTSPVGTLPKPKRLSMNHLSTTSLTTLVLCARASGRLASFVFPAGSVPSPAFQASFRRTRNSTIRRSPVDDLLLLCRGLVSQRSFFICVWRMWSCSEVKHFVCAYTQLYGQHRARCALLVASHTLAALPR